MSKKTITVKETQISIIEKNETDFISLTDMARYKDIERIDHIIQNWMRLRGTIEFLGLWELLYNPNFKPLEFEGFKRSLCE
jgi:hypothetical protein